MRSRSTFLLLSTMAWAADVNAQGCAMCKAVAQDSGFNVNAGIILLIVVPYTLLFLFFRKKIRSFFKEFMAAKG